MAKIEMQIKLEVLDASQPYLTREVNWSHAPVVGDFVALTNDAIGWEEPVKHRYFNADGQLVLDFGRHKIENYQGDALADLRAAGWS